MTKHGSTTRLVCSAEQFATCKEDKKFAYIVALARATNALTAAHSLMLYTHGGTNSEENRDKTSGFLFSSSLLYEAVKLIYRMKEIFSDNEVFKNGLQRLCDDPVVQNLWKNNLNSLRNRSVFHFLPDMIEVEIKKTADHECVFMEALGPETRDIHYGFADLLAASMLVGVNTTNGSAFRKALAEVWENIGNLTLAFMDGAEDLIFGSLIDWGFHETSVTATDALNKRLSVSEKTIEPQIRDELYRALEYLGADQQLLATVGSWGDTLEGAEVLRLIKQWNDVRTVHRP